MCTTRRPFQRPEQSPEPKPKNNKLSNEKVHCRKVSATFSRSLKCCNFQGKCKNEIFSRTVFANEKTHLGPTLNTCKVGAWRAALKNFHSLLFSAQRLVHVCWCTLGALSSYSFSFLNTHLAFKKMAANPCLALRCSASLLLVLFRLDAHLAFSWLPEGAQIGRGLPIVLSTHGILSGGWASCTYPHIRTSPNRWCCNTVWTGCITLLFEQLTSASASVIFCD